MSTGLDIEEYSMDTKKTKITKCYVCGKLFILTKKHSRSPYRRKRCSLHCTRKKD